MTLPCRKDYVVQREDTSRAHVHEGYTILFENNSGSKRMRRGEWTDNEDAYDQDAGFAEIMADGGAFPFCPPPPSVSSSSFSSTSSRVDDLSPSMMTSPLGDYFYSSNDASEVSSCASPLSPLSLLASPLPLPLSPGLTLQAFPEQSGTSSATESDPLSDYAEDTLLTTRSSSCESICMDDLSLSSDDTAMEDEEGSFEDLNSSNDEMCFSPSHTPARDAHDLDPQDTRCTTMGTSSVLPWKVVKEEPRDSTDACRLSQNTHKKAMMDSIRTHHLLPHFQQVVRFISEENFVPKIGEDELRVQQRRLLEVSSFPSFDDFLKTEVGLVDDVEISFKIAEMRRLYDNEVRKLDKCCNQFVDRLASMLEDHNKIRTVTEHEMKAKAIIIHCKFQLLRCLLTKTVSDQVRMLLEQREIQLIHKQLIKPAHLLSQPLQDDNTYKPPKLNSPLRATTTITTPTSTSTINKKDTATDKNSGRPLWMPTSFSRKTWKVEIGKGSSDKNAEVEKKVESKQEAGPQAGVKKRRKKSLSKAATEVLNAWFNEHIHDPYPSEKEKRQLASSLGIHLSQVNNWFGNKRIRHKRKMAEVSEDFCYATQH